MRGSQITQQVNTSKNPLLPTKESEYHLSNNQHAAISGREEHTVTLDSTGRDKKKSTFGLDGAGRSVRAGVCYNMVGKPFPQASWK